MRTRAVNRSYFSNRLIAKRICNMFNSSLQIIKDGNFPTRYFKACLLLNTKEKVSDRNKYKRKLITYLSDLDLS